VPSSNIEGCRAADMSCVGCPFCDALARVEGAEVATADGDKVGIVDDIGVSVGIELGDSVGAGVGVSVSGDIEGCVGRLPSSARLKTRTLPV
jgi:hypothetical protein